jgi:hypothetical protein
VANFRWGFLAGIAACIISFITGLIAGVGILHAFLRALLFFGVFFGLGFGLRFIISNFLPELLYDDDEQASQPENEYSGNRINITVGSSGEYAVPNNAKSFELGNIEDLFSGAFRPEAIDRDIKDEYNYQGSGSPADDFEFMDAGSSGSNTGEKPLFTPSFAESGLSGLPDLDAMAAVFSGGGSSFMPDREPSEEYTSDPVRMAAPVRETPSSTNKPQPLKGDFNAKELAKGISTVLSKDK